MTMLKCPACGKQAAVVVKKNDIEEFVRGATSGATCGPVAGGVVLFPGDLKAIILKALRGTIKTLNDITRSAWNWLRSQHARYLVCSACGHYELFEKSDGAI